MKQLWTVAAVFVWVAAANSFAQAGHHGHHGCGGCGACAAPCETQFVEKVIYQPHWVTETRKVQVTKYKTEPRTRTYTVQKCVPIHKKVACDYTVMVPQPRTKTVNYTVCVPVWKDVTQEYQVCIPVWREEQREYTVQVPVWREEQREYTVQVPVWREETRTCTVQVPHQEQREGTRMVCKLVPVTVMKTVCEDQGRWEEKTVACGGCGHGCGGCGHGCGGCGGCGPAHCTHKVWVPNVVQKQVPVTCNKWTQVEEPYTYTVCVYKPENRSYTVKVCDYKPETRVCTVKVCDYKPEKRVATVKLCDYKYETRTRTHKVCEYKHEPRTKEVTYTVCVAEKRTRMVDTVEYKYEPEERTETYHVCVPYTVEEERHVRVCQMVAKTVKVPVCGGCCGGSHGCGGCCH